MKCCKGLIICKYLLSTKICVVFLESRVLDKTCFSATRLKTKRNTFVPKEYSTLGFANHLGDDVHCLSLQCTLY